MALFGQRAVRDDAFRVDSRRPSRAASLLSQSRLGTYQAACGHDFDLAVGMYVWNGQAAAAFYEALHLLEVALRHVALRHTLNEALSAHWSTTWYRDAGVPLTPGSRKKVNEAIGRATAGGVTQIPGRVIA